MIRFFTLAASLALTLLSVVVQAQNQCGQGITANGTLGTFKVFYYDTFTQVTIYSHNVPGQSQTYVLYCDAAPTDVELQSKGISTSVNKFKVPLQNVGVGGVGGAGGTFSSSYIELAGHRNQIKALYQPQDVISPCLQQMVETKAIAPLSNEFNQDNGLDGIFVPVFTYGPKDIWIPGVTNVDPLMRIEYITAVSLFFNDGKKGEVVYDQIKAAYQILERNMNQIPPANKKRIGWVYYDFRMNTWRLRNNDFTKAIIKAAGGIPFPLVGELSDDASITPRDIKILLRNSHVVIDETNFAGSVDKGATVIQKWRELAGFASSSELPVLNDKAVYSIDRIMGKTGATSDFKYRLPSRPDLLLKDLVQAQYKSFGYSFTFLNPGFSYGAVGTHLTSANCTAGNTYNEGDIAPVIIQDGFNGDGTTPPAVGPGMYGTGEYVPDDGKGDGGAGGGGGSKAGVIIAVVCVAAVLVAGFAFVFFKWSRRAKEDRFIELEEEMNNEIPLH
ncbi:MAG: hypothetical protein J3Q66DRAFT_182241 [Benniella sp.]|nr:MAG: hypothetical protein J3Q66DRAFT_182241 [Benniella sp.]